jgi:hypothetical protein
MKLSDLAAASHNAAKDSNHAILIYGDSKTGKTRFVGTAAEIPELERIFWIDLENGSDTLLHMGLSPAALAKVELIKIQDTRETPRGCETILKMMSSKTDILICEEHGKVACLECSKASKPEILFNLKSLTNKDLVVIDSGSQLGDSALAMACAGKPVEYKAQTDDWGTMGKYLGDILGVIQQAAFTNFVVITHTMVVEEEINGVKRDKVFPLIGTKNFCSKCSKYFGTVVFLELKLGKHSGGSASTYKPNHITGSRLNVAIESKKEATMRDILIDGGIIRT